MRSCVIDLSRNFPLGVEGGIPGAILTKFPLPFAHNAYRFTPGNGYLEALVKSNTTVVFNEIDSITVDGIRTADGAFYAVDAIVCATGFDTSHRPAFPVIGRNGQNLRDFWKDEPSHYLSIAVPGFPNYFSASFSLKVL